MHNFVAFYLNQNMKQYMIKVKYLHSKGSPRAALVAWYTPKLRRKPRTCNIIVFYQGFIQLLQFLRGTHVITVL